MSATDPELTIILKAFLGAVLAPARLARHPLIKREVDPSWLRDLNTLACLLDVVLETKVGRPVTPHGLSTLLRGPHENQEGRSSANRFVELTRGTHLVHVDEFPYKDGRIRLELRGTSILLDGYRDHVWPSFLRHVNKMLHPSSSRPDSRRITKSLNETQFWAFIYTMKKFYIAGLTLKDAANSFEGLALPEKTRCEQLLSESETMIALVVVALKTLEGRGPISQSGLAAELCKFIKGRSLKKQRGQEKDPKSKKQGEQEFRYRVGRMCELLARPGDACLLRTRKVVSGVSDQIEASRLLMDIVRNQLVVKLMEACEELQKQFPET